jgi:hypothetical protein
VQYRRTSRRDGRQADYERRWKRDADRSTTALISEITDGAPRCRRKADSGHKLLREIIRVKASWTHMERTRRTLVSEVVEVFVMPQQRRRCDNDGYCGLCFAAVGKPGARGR